MNGLAALGLVILGAGVAFPAWYLIDVGCRGRQRRAAMTAIDRLEAPAPVVGRTAVVNLVDGSTFLGQVAELRSGWVVLENVARVEADGSRVAVDGRAMIGARHALYVQLP